MENLSVFVEFKQQIVLFHIIAVIAGMGTALFSDAVFGVYAKDKKLSVHELRNLRTFSKIVWVSLFFIIITGISIFLSDPTKYLASAKFLSKMTVVLVLTINGLILAKVVQPHLSVTTFLTSKKEQQVRRVAYTCGAISLVSWISALTLAMLKNLPYTYVEIISVYAIVLGIGVTVALQMERRSMRG